MSFLLSIVIYVALNSIPADVKTFDIVNFNGRVVNGKAVEKTIRFTKQEDDAWLAVDLPKDKIGTFKLEKTILTLTPPADEKKRSMMGEMVMDMTRVIMIPDQPDWSKKQDITFKPSGNVEVIPGKDQVEVEFGLKKEGQLKKPKYIVRWD